MFQPVRYWKSYPHWHWHGMWCKFYCLLCAESTCQWLPLQVFHSLCWIALNSFWYEGLVHYFHASSTNCEDLKAFHDTDNTIFQIHFFQMPKLSASRDERIFKNYWISLKLAITLIALLLGIYLWNLGSFVTTGSKLISVGEFVTT